ncbi:hypothetical protein H0266_00885 [Halobacillus locisalis]|uniref:Type IV pilus assembly protein PilN n=1 Tax=Halobacillus locisalis TaxID=220753 RepID=A0A838CP81_9BACI|nr:hypothetical protein [Halobacillus locisalis]MBA2173446.1 hypothetical protein [Halobacillus locisalis]
MVVLIDINLLEEKEQPNRLPLFTIGLGILLLFLIGAVFLWQNQVLSTEQERLQEEVQMLQAEQANYQAVGEDVEQEQRRELVEAANQMDDAVFPTVALVERMIALLPERGYFQSYVFDNSGLLDIQVRFDSLQEVAAYTNALSEERYVDAVEVGNILTESVDEDLNQFEYRPRYIATYAVTIHKQLFREEVTADANGVDS